MAKEKRLIDANAVDYENIMCSQSQLHWLNAIIEKQSTVDAVEVVRCEDCEHCVKNPAGYVCYDPRDIYAEGVKVYANDFCSYGERRCGDG